MLHIPIRKSMRTYRVQLLTRHSLSWLELIGNVGWQLSSRVMTCEKLRVRVNGSTLTESVAAARPSHPGTRYTNNLIHRRWVRDLRWDKWSSHYDYTKWLTLSGKVYGCTHCLGAAVETNSSYLAHEGVVIVGLVLQPVLGSRVTPVTRGWESD